MAREQIYAHIDRNLDDHIGRIQELVRQPSVSLENHGLRECAELVRQRLADLGCSDAAVVDVGDEFPGVYGRLDCGASKTLLVYGHYDVRPAGQEPWTLPPFSGALAPHGPYQQVVFGRGAAASKGPLQAWLNALGSIQAAEGRLPVNVVFLIEGAEILGSANYLKLVDACPQPLAGVDALYGPSAAQGPDGEVSVVLGFKGLLYFELEASSQDWGRGPAGGPVHSATNAVVDSPAWRLVQALATLTSRDGARLAVPGLAQLFDERKTLTAEEQRLLAGLQQRFEGADWNNVIPGLSAGSPVRTFKNDLSGPEVLAEYLYAPSANLSGLRSGYVGPGSKSFLLPNVATATLDIRTITSLDAQEIVSRLRAHLDAQGFPDVRLRVLGAYNWGQTGLDTGLVQAALSTLESHGYGRLLWPMIGFGGPWAHLASQWGIPSLLGASAGHGGRASTSDEYFVIEGDGRVPGLAQVERFYVDFLFNYAERD